MLLMWDIRRNIDPDPMPKRRTVIEFIYEDLPEARRSWWLIVQPGEPGEQVDLCSVDPGYETDLYLETDLRTMTEIWMGYRTVADAKNAGDLVITGNRNLEASLRSWFGLSLFAKVERLVA